MAALSLHCPAEYPSLLLVKTSVLLPRLIAPVPQRSLLALGRSSPCNVPLSTLQFRCQEHPQ